MKEINLLEEQIEKLDSRDFDLDAWKQYTIIALARIFGENDHKIKQIEKINYDRSSWALRDTSGSSSYIETCKKLGKEILLASIDELNTFGLPEKNKIQNKNISFVLNALENELKGSQYKEIALIINSDKTEKEKRNDLKEILNKFGNETSVEILAGILSRPEIKIMV